MNKKGKTEECVSIFHYYIYFPDQIYNYLTNKDEYIRLSLFSLRFQNNWGYIAISN